jgi:hypothetical protein
MCAGIGLMILYLALSQNMDMTVLAVPLLAWIVLFKLFELLQAELIYRRNKPNSIRETKITWPNMVTFAGLLILLCLNMQAIGFPIVVMSLGILLIALEFYNRTVRMYSFSDKGITDLNKDVLVPSEDIEKIELLKKDAEENKKFTKNERE